MSITDKIDGITTSIQNLGLFPPKATPLSQAERDLGFLPGTSQRNREHNRFLYETMLANGFRVDTNKQPDIKGARKEITIRSVHDTSHLYNRPDFRPDLLEQKLAK